MKKYTMGQATIISYGNTPGVASCFVHAKMDDGFESWFRITNLYEASNTSQWNIEIIDRPVNDFGVKDLLNIGAVYWLGGTLHITATVPGLGNSTLRVHNDELPVAEWRFSAVNERRHYANLGAPSFVNDFGYQRELKDLVLERELA